MTSVFQVLAGDDAAEQERIAGTRAVIAAQERAKTEFSKYVSKAHSQEEREVRLSYIENRLWAIVSDVADEYSYADTKTLADEAIVALGGGHKSDCGCGFCKNKGTLPGAKKDDDGDDDSDKSEDKDEEKSESKKPWEKDASGFTSCTCGCEGCDDGNHCESTKCIETKHSGDPGSSNGTKEGRLTRQAAADLIWEHTAADTDTGDTFVQERESLPTADASGLGDTGAVPTDKSRVPDKGLQPVEVPSAQHPVEQQPIHETPDYWKDLPGPSETGDQIDADAPLQAEHNVAPHTDTWTGTEGLASPVTSKWSVIE